MSQPTPDQKYYHLAQKWVEGTITPGELEEYLTWLNTIDNDTALPVPVTIAASREEHQARIYQNIQTAVRKKPRSRLMQVWKAAAIITGITLAGYFGYLAVEPGKLISKQETPVVPVTDIQPGMTGAILTLANGKVIVLDTATNGSIDNRVMKNSEAIVFEADASTTDIRYNSLSTPRARQQQLILPDGSRVWLNAESTIRFPSSFSGDNRQVDLTGEAYLEVAPDKSHPFIVNLPGSSIKVLGTHFNVKAYANESHIETTLLEGSVNFRSANDELLLKPGEQGRLLQAKGLNPTHGLLTLQRTPDLDLVMAWKNGYQSFKNADIETMFRQITRWYDVEVEYMNTIPRDIIFSGEIPREVTLNELLRALESKQIRFDLSAAKRKLYVQFQSDKTP